MAEIIVSVNGKGFPIKEKEINNGIIVAEEYQKKNSCSIAGVLATVATLSVMESVATDGKIAGEEIWLGSEKVGFRKTNPELTTAFLELHQWFKGEFSGYEIAQRQKKVAA